MAKTEIAERVSTTKVKGKEKLKFTIKIEYQEVDKGYLIKCPELDAVAWGKTLAEAKEEIVESIIDVADVLVKIASKNDARLKHAKLIKSCASREEIEELLEKLKSALLRNNQNSGLISKHHDDLC